MDEQAIKEFWQGHPCGDAQVGGLTAAFQAGSSLSEPPTFFLTSYERSSSEPRIVYLSQYLEFRLQEIFKATTLRFCWLKIKDANPFLGQGQTKLKRILETAQVAVKLFGA